MQPIVRVAMPTSEGIPQALPLDIPVEDIYTAATERLASAQGPEQSLIIAPDRSRRAPELARAVASHPGLAMVALPGPVTAVAMVDHVLRVSELTATEGVDVARGLPSFLRTYAIVSSVARVDRPAPSFWTYLAGLLPWTRFGIDVHHGTFVKPQDLPRVVPEASVRISSAPAQRIRSELLPAGSAAHEVSLETPADWWGARHAEECTVLLGTPTEVVTQILSEVPRECVNCHVPTRLSLCPFCGVRQTSGERKVSA